MRAPCRRSPESIGPSTTSAPPWLSLNSGQPPLLDSVHPDCFRTRLAQAVNLLGSAARDVQILKDDLFIAYAARDAERLRQREYLPFEAQPMFHLGSNEERYFNDQSYTMRGPQTIQEALGGYWAELRRAARAAAMALLAEEADMRNGADVDGWTPYRQNLFKATRFTWEEGSQALQWVRSIIALDNESKP